MLSPTLLILETPPPPLQIIIAQSLRQKVVLMENQQS